MLGIAQTGTGKTAAFSLPILHNLAKGNISVKSGGVRVLILTPTRELASQIADNIEVYGKELGLKYAVIFGGVSENPQIKAVQGGVDILIATPGRLLDLTNQGYIRYMQLEVLVLDEADRMLDMGFFDDIAKVAKQCPADRQTLLFSATYPEGIEKLAKQFMRDPQRVEVAPPKTESLIEQRFYEVTQPNRLHTVGQLLRHFRPVSTLAFCNTKQQCKDLVTLLQAEGFYALALYGELEQRERDQVLAQFANRSCSVLVATDVASRGLDINQLEAVINVDITPDPEVHVHRIGRTGRAGATGLALSLAIMNDMGRIGKIEQYQNQPSKWYPLDTLVPASDAPLLPPRWLIMRVKASRVMRKRHASSPNVPQNSKTPVDSCFSVSCSFNRATSTPRKRTGPKRRSSSPPPPRVIPRNLPTMPRRSKARTS